MVLEGEEGWMRKMRDLGALRSGALHSSNRQAAGGHWGRLGGRATEVGGQDLVLRGQAHYHPASLRDVAAGFQRGSARSTPQYVRWTGEVGR